MKSLKLILLSLFAFLSALSCTHDTTIIAKGDLSDNKISKDELKALSIHKYGTNISADEAKVLALLYQESLVNSVPDNKDKLVCLKTIWVRYKKSVTMTNLDSYSIKTDSIPLYLFAPENGNGFTLVAGDKRLPEIMAYSPEGNFDDNPKEDVAVFKKLLPFYIEKQIKEYDTNYDSLYNSATFKIYLNKKSGTRMADIDTDKCVEGTGDEWADDSQSPLPTEMTAELKFMQ